MSLNAQLQAFKSSFVSRIDPAVIAAMTQADAELAASHLAELALRAGDRTPDFELTDAAGGMVVLSERLAAGPVVLSFYRGGWCPYCNLELRALQAVLPDIERLGASLIAISPELPDNSLTTAEKNALTFAVLSDTGSDVARQFGVAFELAQALRPLYERFGHGLPLVNGADWVLPVPATYVIDSDGVIALAFVDTDYRSRLEPDAILSALTHLAARRAA